MKLLSIAAAAVMLGATTVAACPWAGGSFSGEEMSFQAKFTVNADCTEMVFESSGNAAIQEQDTPQNFALTEEKHGWVADINGVTATLLNGGGWVDFVGEGVNQRLQVR